MFCHGEYVWQSAPSLLLPPSNANWFRSMPRPRRSDRPISRITLPLKRSSRPSSKKRQAALATIPTRARRARLCWARPYIKVSDEHEHEYLPPPAVQEQEVDQILKAVWERAARRNPMVL